MRFRRLLRPAGRRSHRRLELTAAGELNLRRPASGAGQPDPWECGMSRPHRSRHRLVIKRQLGHADLAITSVYLHGIDNTETVHAVHERPAPVIPATHGL